jgi:hypothetical protein
MLIFEFIYNFPDNYNYLAILRKHYHNRKKGEKMINQVSGVGQQYRANSTSFGMALKCGKGFTKGLKDLTADEIQILKKNIDDLAYRSDMQMHITEINFDVY